MNKETRTWLTGLLIFFAFPLSSCEQSKTVQEVENNSDLTNLKVVIIDDCEYLQYRVHHNYDIITHKGNCKNHKTK